MIVKQDTVRKRINRQLNHEGERLRKCRSNRWHSRLRCDLGEWYIVNDGNGLVAREVNLESLARELGALRPYEQLAAT